ncbi:hypothetical protein ACQFN5_12775 [Klebsiella sp. WOUb02]|uniref:hypothetical protein n=1 Tax=Klebsiella sp. WOUb02 TaxID=3161071 RepID=UPI003CEF8BBC
MKPFKGWHFQRDIISTSKDETKARWTIDIMGNESLEELQGKVKNKIEIKFR